MSVHGGLLHDELASLGLRADDILDVSVNVNPYGPCQSVLDAIRAAPLERYPDPSAAPARAALAGWLDVPSERVVIGNGAVDLLWSLARALVRPGEAVVVVEPAFSELRTAAAHVGARIVEYRLRPEHDFAFELAALDALVDAQKPALVYVCTPANPTGKSLPIAGLVRVAHDHPDSTFIVDLSFSSLSERHGDDPLRASDRVVWLRSLTKDLALAGLRVGFAVAPRTVVATVEAGRPPWSVNALAQAAAVAATSREAQEFVKRSREQLLRDRVHLEAELRRVGLRPHPSETLYSLVGLGEQRQATALRSALLARHGVLVRDTSSFGLPNHVRICARPAVQTARLIRALSKELDR